MSEQDEKQQQQSNQAVGGSGSADSRGVVALMVEVADALADDTRRPSLAVAVPGGKGEREDREKGRGRGMRFVYLFVGREGQPHPLMAPSSAYSGAFLLGSSLILFF